MHGRIVWHIIASQIPIFISSKRRSGLQVSHYSAKLFVQATSAIHFSSIQQLDYELEISIAW